MLRLLGVLLSCGALCLAVPVPPAAETGCTASSLIREILTDIQTLKSKDDRKITPLNNVMEFGGNVTTYLEGFIVALQSSERLEERKIAEKLQKIPKSCLEWKEEDQKLDENFLTTLECLLKLLNQRARSEESA